MRKRMGNHFFTVLYPGLHPSADKPDDDWPQVAITRSGEFVSVCAGVKGESGCAVFYSGQSLREMADALYEAAEIFEQYQATPEVKRHP